VLLLADGDVNVTFNIMDKMVFYLRYPDSIRIAVV